MSTKRKLVRVNNRVKEVIDPVVSGAAVWGSITGTLSAQTDLQTALNTKQAAYAILTTLGVLANASGVLTNNGAGVLSWASIPAGVAGSDTQIQFNQAGAFGASSNLIFDYTNKYLGVGGTPTSTIHATSALTTSILSESTGVGGQDAHVRMKVSGASGGDPHLQFDIAGVTSWSMGVDNSDSDAFVLSQSSSLGTTNRLRITTSGNITTGVWQATAIDIPYGGTNATTAAGARVNILPSLAGNTLKVLRVNAGETDVEWATASGGVSDGDYGDITVSGSGATWTIDANVVTYAKFQQVAALSVVGNGTNALANASAITGTANQVLVVNGAGTSLAFGQVNLSSPSAVTGTLAESKGGTGNNTYAIGDLLYASGATTLSKLADVSVGSYLRSGGVTTAPLWSTLKLPNTATSTYIPYATSANTIGESGNLLYDGTQFITPKHAGSAASGQNLTLVSTTHATKGKIILGTASAYDEVNDALGIGTTTPYSGSDSLRIEKTSAAAGKVSMRIKNNTATGYVQWTAEQGATSTYLYQFGGSYSTSGRFIQNSGLIEANYKLYLSGADATVGEIGFYTRGNNLRMTLTDTLTFSAAVNIAFNTTTGTKIGTATTQKIGVWNATPIVQPTTAVAAATFVANTSAIANDTATFDGYTIGQVVKALRNIGLLA